LTINYLHKEKPHRLRWTQVMR